MEHVCHAEGCDILVSPKMLMCRKHWRMVPKALQARVWATYRPGQEVAKTPTPAYLIAHFSAVTAVANKEGRRSPYTTMLNKIDKGEIDEAGLDKLWASAKSIIARLENPLSEEASDEQHHA